MFSSFKIVSNGASLGDMDKSIDLNNAAYQAFERGDYKTSLTKYQQAIELKTKIHGKESLHVCISLSGLCDAYLKLNDVETATKEAKRMLSIGEKIQNPEQIRIAKEILGDCEKALKKASKK